MDYKVTLSKTKVAERQLDTAVWLWFNSGDIVSILTLTGAAMGILDGLFFHTRKTRPHPFTKEFAPKGMTLRQARLKIQEAEGFAKHARNDPEGSYEYKEYWIGAYLFLTIAAHTELVRPYNPRSLRALFAMWYGIHFPAAYNLDVSLRVQATNFIQVEHLKKLSRTEFFKETGGDFVGNLPRPDGIR